MKIEDLKNLPQKEEQLHLRIAELAGERDYLQHRLRCISKAAHSVVVAYDEPPREIKKLERALEIHGWDRE